MRLGNLYAGCLWAAIQRDLGDTDAMVRTGDVAPILDWLRTHVHRRGSILMPRDLIEEATGAAPDEGPLLAYLEAKFGGLYDLVSETQASDRRRGWATNAFAEKHFIDQSAGSPDRS